MMTFVQDNLLVGVVRMVDAGLCGKGLALNYSVQPTPFGDVLIASTSEGVCRLEFVDGGADVAEVCLHRCFPQARLSRLTDDFQAAAMAVFSPVRAGAVPVRLHLRGTDFQMDVWTRLMAIPRGTTSTYGEIARAVGRPAACRAVGAAVGANPVSVIIPCHRVLRSDGTLGGYRWGTERKKALLRCENLNTYNSSISAAICCRDSG